MGLGGADFGVLGDVSQLHTPFEHRGVGFWFGGRTTIKSGTEGGCPKRFPWLSCQVVTACIVTLLSFVAWRLGAARTVAPIGIPNKLVGVYRKQHERDAHQETYSEAKAKFKVPRSQSLKFHQLLEMCVS